MQSQATRRGRVQSAATKGLPTVVAGDHPAHLPPASFPPSFFTWKRWRLFHVHAFKQAGTQFTRERTRSCQTTTN